MIPDAVVNDGDLLTDYLKNDNEKALGVLISRHQNMVFSVCNRILRNYSDAEEAAQAVFLIMLKKAKQLTSRPSIAGFLHLTASNIAKDELRRIIARVKREEHGMERIITSHADDKKLKEAFATQFDESLAGISEKYRTPLVLHYMEGVSQEEVATRLNVSSGTIYSLISRGREKLRKQLSARRVSVSTAVLCAFIGELEARASVDIASSFLEVKSIGMTTNPEIAHAFSENTINIYQEALKNMFYTKIKIAFVAISIIVGVLGLSSIALSNSANKSKNSELTVPEDGGKTVADLKTNSEYFKKVVHKASVKSSTKIVKSSIDGEILGDDFADYLNKKGKEINKSKCQANLKRLSMFLMTYASNNKGAYPEFDGVEGLAQLLGYGVMKYPEILISPGTNSKKSKTQKLKEDSCDYYYKGGLILTQVHSPSSTKVAWDKIPHEDGFICVLYADGSVRSNKNVVFSEEEVKLMKNIDEKH